MRRGIADLWYLNVVWGVIFTILFGLRTSSFQIFVSTLALSLFFTVISYYGEKLMLKASLAGKHQSLTYQLEQNREINRISNIGILILNLIAYFVLWFVLPNFVGEDQVYQRTYIWGFFLLIIYVDFFRTGKRMAQEKFILGLTDQQLEDIEKIEPRKSQFADSLFTFMVHHRKAGQIYMASLLILTAILTILVMMGHVDLWVPIAVFFIGFFIEVGISFVYGSREYRQGLKSEDSIQTDTEESAEVE